MAAPATTAPGNNLGFLTILQDPAGTLGGYLVTNLWGRPLEFRLTSAVQNTLAAQAQLSTLNGSMVISTEPTANRGMRFPAIRHQRAVRSS